MTLNDLSALHLLVRQDLVAATEVQVSAFLNDPLWVYLFPDSGRRERTARQTFRAALRFALLNGQLYGTGHPTEGIAIWTMPHQKTRLRAVLGSGLWRLLFSPFVLQVRRSIPVFSQFERMQKQYAPQPHYYLNTISVLPDAQGKGLASKLIRPFLARADVERVGSYTETMTPSNVGLYQHFGFKVMEDYSVPNTHLHIWSLYRPFHG
jgi:ribosomal protein S18 acetylase RimI-like enzyme